MIRRIIVCVLMCSFAHAAPLAAGKAAPGFILKDAQGKPVSLSAYKGKVVLLNFWATWCAPCRVEMPWFEEFSAKYRDKGLVVLGISMDEGGWKPIQTAVAKLKVTYPIALGNPAVAKLYGIGELLPETFIIDRTGKIQAVKEGFGNKDEFDSEIKKLL